MIQGMQAPQSEKSEKSNIISISEDKKKKKEGAQKKGVKIHPFHLPWIRACNPVRRSEGLRGDPCQNQLPFNMHMFFYILRCHNE